MHVSSSDHCVPAAGSSVPRRCMNGAGVCSNITALMWPYGHGELQRPEQEHCGQMKVIAATALLLPVNNQISLPPAQAPNHLMPELGA